MSSQKLAWIKSLHPRSDRSETLPNYANLMLASLVSHISSFPHPEAGTIRTMVMSCLPAIVTNIRTTSFTSEQTVSAFITVLHNYLEVYSHTMPSTGKPPAPLCGQVSTNDSTALASGPPRQSSNGTIVAPETDGSQHAVREPNALRTSNISRSLALRLYI